MKPMYYITNPAGKIVATDTQILEHFDVADADAFDKQIALGEIGIDLQGEEVSLTANGKTVRYPAVRSQLSGILGDLTLVQIDTSHPSETEGEEDETLLYDILDEPLHEEETSVQEESTSDELLPLEEDELISLKDETTQAEESEAEQSPKLPETEESSELLDLLLPEEADNAIEEIAKETPPSKEETTPIYIDIDTVSAKIGISHDDYNMFLDEYIDTALALEDALQKEQTEEQAEALKKLSHLSNVLHLPIVGSMLHQIEESSGEEQHQAVQTFFTALGRLTTAHFEEEKKPAAQAPSETPPPAEEKPEAETESVSGTQRAPIDLSDVKPIHFDFQLEAAAEDLSLPVELIEEFVNDFIQQAHEETEKMLAAYEKGDLETVQKIGHLLKGTSSNLRIIPLSDTLYEIQFNEDIERVPELVRNYWAHFLSLENQFKLISNK